MSDSPYFEEENLLRKDRVDPDIKGINDVSYTDEEVALFKEKTTEYLKKYWGKPFWFTCDTCALKNNCLFTYETYNTNGDCLASK